MPTLPVDRRLPGDDDARIAPRASRTRSACALTKPRHRFVDDVVGVVEESLHCLFPLPRHFDGVAAVDQQVGAVDHVRAVRGEEHRRRRDLFGFARSGPRGSALLHRLALRAVPRLLAELGQDHRRRDRVDGDAVLAPFQRQHLGQADHGELRRAVGDVLVDGDRARLRCEIDDLAAACRPDHRAADGLRHQEACR